MFDKLRSLCIIVDNSPAVYINQHRTGIKGLMTYMIKNYRFSHNIAVFSFIILSLGLLLFVTMEGIAFAQFAGNDLFGEINKILQTVNHALSTNPPSVDVTGTYSCNDGATYYVRQVP